MPIDPKKMQTYLKQNAGKPKPPVPVDEENEGLMADAGEDDVDDFEDQETPEPDEHDGPDAEFADLGDEVEDLYDFGEAMHDEAEMWEDEELAAPEHNPETRVLSPDKKSAILGEMGRLKGGLPNWLRGKLKGISWEGAQSLASKIGAERGIDNPTSLGAWFYWAGKAV